MGSRGDAEGAFKGGDRMEDGLGAFSHRALILDAFDREAFAAFGQEAFVAFDQEAYAEFIRVAFVTFTLVAFAASSH